MFARIFKHSPLDVQLGKDKGLGTVLIWIASKNNLEMAKWLAIEAREVFVSSLQFPDSEGWTPLHVAACCKNLAMVKLMNDYAPEAFAVAMSKQVDANGNTPLHIAVENNDQALVKYMIQSHPQNKPAALWIKNKASKIPLQLARHKESTNIFDMLLPNVAPELQINNLKKDLDNLEEMRKNVETILGTWLKSDVNGMTPIHYACKLKSLDQLKMFFELAPEIFKKGLYLRNLKGNTPIHEAVCSNDLEALKFISQNSFEEFAAGLTIQNEDGNTPLMVAVSQTDINLEMIKFLIDVSPSSLTILNKEGLSPLTVVQSWRSSFHREIVELLKKNPISVQYYRAFIDRKALSHAWSIPGKSDMIRSDTNELLSTIPLNGHAAPQWFHLMKKDLLQFKLNYPHLMDEAQVAILYQIFEKASNSETVGLEEDLNTIQKGFPLFLSAGIVNHLVIIVIWNDQLIICNCGNLSRAPIEVFHFDPQKFNGDILEKIYDVSKSGNALDYQNLFFNELKLSLGLAQTPLDKFMQNFCKLPFQRMGNCSLISPMTAVYAFVALVKCRGMTHEGKLLTATAESYDKAHEGQINAVYGAWSQHFQLTLLERSIRHVNNKWFIPDHRLLTNSFKTAYSQPLDQIGLNRLNYLADIYLKSLSEVDAATVRKGINVWKSSNYKI
jgi:ankyrin repeat protein